MCTSKKLQNGIGPDTPVHSQITGSSCLPGGVTLHPNNNFRYVHLGPIDQKHGHFCPSKYIINEKCWQQMQFQTPGD